MSKLLRTTSSILSTTQFIRILINKLMNSVIINIHTKKFPTIQKENKDKCIDEIVVSDDEQMDRLDGVIQFFDSFKHVFCEYIIDGYTNINSGYMIE